MNGGFQPVDEVESVQTVTSRRREIVTGMSEREYITVNSGEILEFHSDGAALLPPNEGDSDNFVSSPTSDLDNQLQTSWVSVQRGDINTTELVSEGVEVAMFSPSTVPSSRQSSVAILDHDPIVLHLSLIHI